MIMRVAVADRVGDVVNRVLEVVANPLNIHGNGTCDSHVPFPYDAIDGFLPMRWVEYDHEEVPISMDKYSIHGRNILSMDLKYPWVPCNIYTGWRTRIRTNF